MRTEEEGDSDKGWDIWRVRGRASERWRGESAIGWDRERAR